MQRRPLLTFLLIVGSSLLALSQSVDITKYRTINGEHNNLFNPEWGAVGHNLSRLGSVGYADGISEPAGPGRPNPRTISNAIFAQRGLINDPLELSDFCWVFGQFLDHDLGLTPDGTEDASISVPAGDPHFDPLGEGKALIPAHRNIWDYTTGTGVDNPRQHPNMLTAFIDGSAVYGSTEAQMRWLRSFEDGKLKVSSGNLLPYNTVTGEIGDPIDPTAPHMDNPVRRTNKLFVAGDSRANENPLLLSYHTLFVREHNRVCDELAAEHPNWDDERLFQHARKMVGGFIQAIVYEEWLPTLGVEVPAYTGYNANVNPQLLNEFTGAAFRLGHTLLNGVLRRLDNDGQIMPGGNLPLRDAFFDPSWVSEENSLDIFFKGMATQAMQMFDSKVIDDVRNFLFGMPGAGGLDLASINIQRGRERGLVDLNTFRRELGLPAYTSFFQIPASRELARLLSELYAGDLNNIDLWVGLLAEKPLPGAVFGETITRVMAYQFGILRDGDRFYYENDPVLSDEEKAMIKNTTMHDILMRNTGIKLMQDNVFKSMPHAEICDNLTVDVSGIIRTEDGRPVRDVSLFLDDNDAGMELLTGADGTFSFPPAAGCFVKGLQVFKDDNVHNGVSTVDLILVTKHILGAKLLDSPYKMIAADVDHSNSISVIDLVRLRKVILSVYDSFPNNTAWRFIREDFEFTNPANPFLDDLPDGMSFDLLAGDLNQRFIAIKVGDVNGTVRLDGEQRAVASSDNALVFQIEDRAVRPGEWVEVVVTTRQINKVEGFQFTLDYDETALAFDGLEKGDLSNLSADGNFGVFDLEGVITASWNKPEGEPPLSASGNPVVFRTRFRASRAGRLSDFIQLSSEFTSAEAYDAELETRRLALDFTETPVERTPFELLQNRPNPVRYETVIPFILPEGGDVTLYITDLNGRTIYRQTDVFPAGEQNWRLNRDQLQVAGTYFYTMETASGRATKKLLVVD